MKEMTYRVAGRYLKGTSVTHYVLIRVDGKRELVSRDRVIFMISKGLIENMRLQVLSDTDIVIRGKGVNLNNLPVYNRDKISKGIKIEKQYRINKRIMKGTKCIGYEVVDTDNKSLRLSKEEVYKLANNKLITNAELKTVVENGETKSVLRGIDCNLLKLDVLIVDYNNKIVNHKEQNRDITLRAVLMKENGILKNKSNGSNIRFMKGNFLVIDLKGNINVVTKDKLLSSYEVCKDYSSAMCDSLLDKMDDYIVEIYGKPDIKLDNKQMLKWTIIKKK